ncbi:MAG: HAMP domain-containing histidine kinase [Tissierellales bacterium]|nr:HAMP domain-containing histidine kinase [Tissierellales bacterium]
MKKLFILTSIMSVILFLGLMGFQDYFFDKLYFKTKVNDVVSNSDSLIKSFEDENRSILEIVDRTRDISRENNFDMFIVNENKESLSDLIEFNEVVLVKADSKEYLVDISSLGMNSILNIKENYHMKVEGKTYKNWEIFVSPIKIRTEEDGLLYNRLKIFAEGEKIAEKYFLRNEVDINERLPINPSMLNDNIISIEGEVESIRLNEDFNYEYSYLKGIFERYADSQKSIKYIRKLSEGIEVYEDAKTESSVLVYSKKIGKSGLSICVVASLQEIGEAGNVMKRYYPYMILIAAVIITIMAYIYSKIIAKPLIELNKVAMKMARLDFEVYSNINSNDELGTLSKSLNTLSKSLKESLDELKFANDELKSDIEKEKKQEQIRREFVANVSHELKTPIGVIKSFTEGIKDGVAGTKKDYYLDVIIEEADEMNALVLEMIELSRLESDNLKLKLDRVNISQLMNKNYEKLKSIISDKKIDFAFEIDCEDIDIIGDAKKINHVVENLFSNAVYHTDEDGKIIIRVKCDDEKVKIEFENTCSEIRDEELERIWDRFYKIDQSRTKVENSTGLGLPIVKSILERHKCEFGVESSELGIMFYFWIDRG